MQHDDADDWKAPPLSSTAIYVYAILDRRGRSMRMGPLRQEARLDDRTLSAAINELQERCWVRITWRKRPEHTDDDESRPMRDAHRITATRFGRMRYALT